MKPELSIILPFYKRAAEFEFALNVNDSCFFGHEVVIVIDEPESGPAVLEILSKYRRINWKVVQNPTDHAWRNPAKAINVGIRHATKDFVLVMSPESICLTNVPKLLLNKSFVFFAAGRNIFTTGRVAFGTYADIEEIGLRKTFQAENKYLYGSICAQRQSLIDIQGYDESNEGWGCDDDNIRARLILNDVCHVPETLADLLHPSKVKRSTGGSTAKDHLLRPDRASANGESWGTDFNEVIYP